MLWRDKPYRLVEGTFSTGEIESIFDSMTSELFDARPDLRHHGSMMVHLFPDLLKTHTDENYSDKRLPGKPDEHSSFSVLRVEEYEFGNLSLCRQEFHGFGTYYEWYHFVRHDHLTYGDALRDRLIASGIMPAHEWWISYMCPDAHFQRHVDAISPLVRYSFVVRQPHADASIEIGDSRYFFPEGTAYVMDGEVPHQVLNSGDDVRVMLLGSIDPGASKLRFLS